MVLNNYKDTKTFLTTSWITIDEIQPSFVDEIYLAKWLKWLTANADAARVLGSTTASYVIVESEGRQMN
jgi:hypothetical protein